MAIATMAANGTVYALCDTCRRWVKKELGRRLPLDRWICNDCDATRREASREPKKEEER